MSDPHLVKLTTDITKAFVANHPISADQVSTMITGVYASLEQAQHPAPVYVAPMPRPKRKYTRRVDGQVVADSASGFIADEQEVEQAIEIVEELLENEDAPEDGSEGGSEEGRWVEPEPMFED